jgi:hypothetical protein
MKYPGRSIASIVAWVCLTLASRVALAEEISADIRGALRSAQQFELLSIDPDPGSAAKAADRLHGYAVLGRTGINDPARRESLIAALEQAAKDNDDRLAMCFRPRHAVRATSPGKTVDLIICFECMKARVYVDNREQGGFLTTRSPEPMYDAVLRAVKIPLARDLEKARRSATP